MSDAADGGLFPRVYEELKVLAAARLAREAPGHTLDATALVHEAYLRLGDASFADRSRLLSAAAAAMQRILVDHARRRRAAKRGAGGQDSRIHGSRANASRRSRTTVLDIDEALARLAIEDPSSAEVARIRLFGGLSIDEAALAMGVSRATAFREWAYARAWLATALGPS